MLATPQPAAASAGAAIGDPDRAVEPGELHTLFPVTLSKFVVMSITTMGFYELYWAYRNWQRINSRANDNERVSPFWRAVFAPLWGFSLFARVRDTAAQRGVNVGWAPGLLGALYLVVSITWRLPDPWWLISMLAFIPMMPVVRTIQELHAPEPASEGQNGRYSGANIAWIIIGGIFLLLAVWGTFYPPPEGS